MTNAKNIDLFEGHSDDWRKSYWKDKLSHKDEVDRISEEINSASVSTNIKKEKQDDFFYAGSTVETVLKPRNLENESKDFFKAQLDMTKDFLPKETMAQKGTVVDINRVRLDLFDQQWHRNSDFAKATVKDGKMEPTPLDAYNAIYPSGNPIPVSPNTKPTSSIADDHKGGYRGDDGIPQNRIGSIQLEEKSGASVPIGDNYLPDGAWNGKNKVKMPITQQSSGWDAQKFDDGNFQCGVGKQLSSNLGDLLQDYIIKNKITPII